MRSCHALHAKNTKTVESVSKHVGRHPLIFAHQTEDKIANCTHLDVRKSHLVATKYHHGVLFLLLLFCKFVLFLFQIGIDFLQLRVSFGHHIARVLVGAEKHGLVVLFQILWSSQCVREREVRSVLNILSVTDSFLSLKVIAGWHHWPPSAGESAGAHDHEPGSEFSSAWSNAVPTP